MGVILKIAMAVLGSLLAAPVAFGQAAYTSPETGIKPLGSYASWGGIDSVSLTNGNLLLNIPLFSLPGRELPVSLGVSFNSQFMEQRTVPGEMGQTRHGLGIPGLAKEHGDWRHFKRNLQSNSGGRADRGVLDRARRLENAIQ